MTETLKSCPRATRYVFGCVGVAYLAILPMAGTLALRNWLLLLALVGAAWRWRESFARTKPSIPVLAWGLYLLLFPFFSTSPALAFESLGGQWVRSLLSMIAGVTTVLALNKSKAGGIFWIGLASAVPNLVHLALFLGDAMATMSLPSMEPFGYWGRETHHADLGYSAGQAVILLSAFLFAGRAPKIQGRLALVLIIACLLSTALAHSRAGFAFCIIGILFVFLVRHAGRLKLGSTMFGALGAGLVVLIVVAAFPQRGIDWHEQAYLLTVGLRGNALEIECDGTSSVEPEVLAHYGPGERASEVLVSLREGDAARLVVLRAGFQLFLARPWGSDGSRHAYQRLLQAHCRNPAILMAHTHNGWIDTALALGGLGVAFYLAVLLNYIRQGLMSLKRGGPPPEWALALVSLSLFWIARGIFDSVYRDHMLEMQGFVLAYAAASLGMTAHRATTSELHSSKPAPQSTPES